MKIFILTTMLMVTTALTAVADSFQFYYQYGNNFYYAAYESIRIYNSRNSQVYSSYTDKFGRAVVKIATGTYTCKIMYKKVEYTFPIRIDNTITLKKQYFPISLRRNIRV